MTIVAVLGRGTMGEPIARNIERAGLEIRAWSPSAGGDAAGAARGADVVLTIVPDGDAVEEAVFGLGGAASAMDPGTLWIQSSTVGLAAADRLGVLAREHGIVYVDAPVLGTKGPAENAGLTVLASGPAEAQERCREIFDAIGKRTFWLGEAGAGSRMKLVANNWLLALVEGTAETIALAQALDIDAAQFLQIVEGGAIDAPYLRLKGKAILAGELEPSFRLELAHKDAQLVLAAGSAGGVELPLTEAVALQLERAIELGHGDDDMAAVYYATARERR